MISNIVSSDLFLPSLRDHISKIKMISKQTKRKKNKNKIDCSYYRKQEELLTSYWIKNKRNVNYIPFPLCEGGICDDSCTLKYKLIPINEAF